MVRLSTLAGPAKPKPHALLLAVQGALHDAGDEDDTETTDQVQAMLEAMSESTRSMLDIHLRQAAQKELSKEAKEALANQAQNVSQRLTGMREQLAKQEQGCETPVTIEFYHCDHLGTPIALTNDQHQVVWAARLDPWGNVQEEFNPSGMDQAIRLPGQHHDRETGLYYNRHRYYDPGIGSYINQDPIGLAGGVNTSSYVGGNPLTGADPTGLEIEYANHPVALGLNHSKIIITPNNQALYANDPRFQNIGPDGKRFATLGAGPNGSGRLESGINRPKDVNEASTYRKKLDLPCQYKNEDDAIEKLMSISNNYNNNKLFYTLLPHRVFDMPTGYNSNSFISGLGGAAGFDMPIPANTGAITPGYQNPVPASRF